MNASERAIVVKGRECIFWKSSANRLWLVCCLGEDDPFYHLDSDGQWTTEQAQAEDWHATEADARAFALSHADQHAEAGEAAGRGVGGCSWHKGFEPVSQHYRWIDCYCSACNQWLIRGDGHPAPDDVAELRAEVERLRGENDRTYSTRYARLIERLGCNGSWTPEAILRHAGELYTRPAYVMCSNCETMHNPRNDCSVCEKNKEIATLTARAEAAEARAEDRSRAHEATRRLCLKTAQERDSLRSELADGEKIFLSTTQTIGEMHAASEVCLERAEAERDQLAARVKVLEGSLNELVNDRDDRVSPGVKTKIANVLAVKGEAADAR